MDTNQESVYLNSLGRKDHKAFDALFLQYHPRLKNFLTGFMKDEEEASDMAQEIFYKIWVNSEKISKVDSFKAYLFKMARNMIYDYYKHSLIKEKYIVTQNEITQYTDILEEEIYAKELSLVIDMAVERMPEQRRRIFKMSRNSGLTNEEIALQMNINKRTVENHITKALAELRKIAKLFAYLFL